MRLFDFFRRDRLRTYVESGGGGAEQAPAVTTNLAGRPVFSLEQHLANNQSPFALPDVPRRVDHRQAMGWTPKNDSIFVLPLQEADRSRGGIIAPDDSRQRPQKGVVLAIGAGLWDAEQQQLYPVECGIGDLVTYGKYSGVVFEIEGIEILVVRNIEISARRHAGTYELQTHHVDVGGLGERRVYHEQHTFCEFCERPVSDVIEEERARLQVEHREALGFHENWQEPPADHQPFVPYEANGEWWYYAFAPGESERRFVGPFKNRDAAQLDAHPYKERAELDAEDAALDAALPPPMPDAPSADDEAARAAIAEERARMVAARDREVDDDIPY